MKAGYEIIDKIELFLNTILPDFEMSIENPLTLKNFTQDYVNTITNEINRVVVNLKDYRFNLAQMITTRETATDWKGDKISVTRSIEYSIERPSCFFYHLRSFICSTIYIVSLFLLQMKNQSIY